MQSSLINMKKTVLYVSSGLLLAGILVWSQGWIGPKRRLPNEESSQIQPAESIRSETMGSVPSRISNAPARLANPSEDEFRRPNDVREFPVEIDSIEVAQPDAGNREVIPETEFNMPTDNYDEQMQEFMQEMDALLGEYEHNEDEAANESTSMALEELESEMKDFMRKKGLPAVSRDGPNAWTVYADD